MAIADDRFDITKNIRIIEMLKAQLLSGIADLYTNLSSAEGTEEERKEILAEMTIITYMLSGRLGLSSENLEQIMKKKLRVGILEENNSLHSDTAELLKYLSGR